MAAILRGEIRWADLDPIQGREQAGLRPVLVLSQDVFNDRSGTVIAMALASQPQRAGFPLTLDISSLSCQSALGSRSAKFRPFGTANWKAARPQRQRAQRS